jgi:hypothetical protein
LSHVWTSGSPAKEFHHKPKPGGFCGQTALPFCIMLVADR